MLARSRRALGRSLSGLACRALGKEALQERPLCLELGPELGGLALPLNPPLLPPQLLPLGLCQRVLTQTHLPEVLAPAPVEGLPLVPLELARAQVHVFDPHLAESALAAGWGRRRP